MDELKLASAVCPGIVHPQVRYKNLLRQLLQPGIRWLDLGCGHQLIRSWALLPGEDEFSFAHAPALSVGIDRDGPALRGNRCMPHRVAGDIQALPFSDNTFEVVTANMVLEHIENPAALMSEVWRVLRPGGVFLFCTPNKYYPASLLASLLPEEIKSRLVARVTPRRESDVYRTFYRVNTQSAIVHYSEAVGFRVKYLEAIETLTWRWRGCFGAKVWANCRRIFLLCSANLVLDVPAQRWPRWVCTMPSETAAHSRLCDSVLRYTSSKHARFGYGKASSSCAP